MVTLEEAKELSKGDILYHTKNKNKDGSAQRWKLTSDPKTWKRNPEKIQIKVKYGLYRYDIISERDLELVMLRDDPFIRKVRKVLENEM